ncbi:hypothetical protein GN958_ATG15699 [Phytophthora infestans]|uniref:Uncharacterized protein n=1 Tax=Phytophthora infestans TaxID=4787 RepID=A0A8S9U786_PHYIN|nr:hypothetical protein GN958_ATG15699 [Phytophthora infestans]
MLPVQIGGLFSTTCCFGFRCAAVLKPRILTPPAWASPPSRSKKCCPSKTSSQVPMSRFCRDAHSREHQRLDTFLASERLLAEEAEDDDKTVPFNSWNNVPDTLNHLLTLVLRWLGDASARAVFAQVLPSAADHRLTGIISGPFLSNLLNEDVVTCLAHTFISFQAHQEIYLPELRPQIKSILTLLSTYYYTGRQLGIALMFASISVVCRTSHEPGTWHLSVSVLVFFFVLRVLAFIYGAKLDVSPESFIFTKCVVLMNARAGGASRSLSAQRLGSTLHGTTRR